MKIVEYEKLTIYEVEEFHKNLMQWCEEKRDDLFVDCSKIHKIDLAGIQLLLSVKKTCEAGKKQFILKNIRSEIRESLLLAGVETYLWETEDD